MTYFKQIKQKHENDFHKAYIEYILSKTIYRSFNLSDDAFRLVYY